MRMLQVVGNKDETLKQEHAVFQVVASLGGVQ
jgi:hypothetical protein